MKAESPLEGTLASIPLTPYLLGQTAGCEVGMLV